MQRGDRGYMDAILELITAPLVDEEGREFPVRDRVSIPYNSKPMDRPAAKPAIAIPNFNSS